MNKAFRAVDHRRVALHFDVLRYSFAMAKLAAERMRDTLDEVASRHRKEQHSEECVISALLDAWSLVDMSHRARQVIEQLPQLPRSEVWVRSFLRRTAKVEKLRHHVQHLRRSVNDPTAAEPVWGALSWIPRDEPDACYTIFSGNLIEGHSAQSISYDTVESRYTAEVELSAAGGSRIDLWHVGQTLQQLRTDLVEWMRQTPNTKHAYGQTLVWKWSVVGPRKPGAPGFTPAS
jgi:hypothetical protein